MRKNSIRLGIFLIVASLLPLGNLFASSGNKKQLEGSYPIVLVHGILGFDDGDPILGGLIKYWGGLDDYLRSEGVSVLTPAVQPFGYNVERAGQLKNEMAFWMAANNFSKAHLLGHSQGGTTSRFLAANLSYSSKVSSITSINTPHHGTPVADIALDVIPEWMHPFVDSLVSSLAKLLYGNEGSVVAMGTALRTDYLAQFNQNTPNAGGVDYFSYGSYITVPDLIQHPIMALTYPICALGGLTNGQGARNDGVVPTSSMKWGTWKGYADWNFYATGLDHLQITNLAGGGALFYDQEGFYLKMAKNAMNSQ